MSGGEPGTRTLNLAVKSRLLCQIELAPLTDLLTNYRGLKFIALKINSHRSLEPISLHIAAGHSANNTVALKINSHRPADPGTHCGCSPQFKLQITKDKFSPNIFSRPKVEGKFGVDDGTRTHDDRDHNPGLYQLSYAHHYRYRTKNYSLSTRGLRSKLRLVISVLIPRH